MTTDQCCTIVPYFQITAENIAQFKQLCDEFVAQTDTEAGCLYYGFSFAEAEADGSLRAHCREGYRDAESLLAHLQNVDEILGRALAISKITRLEVHAPADELAKLRAPLAKLQPKFFTLEYGFRR